MLNKKRSSIITRLEKEFNVLKTKLNFLAKDFQEVKKATPEKSIKKVVTKTAIKPTVTKINVKKVAKKPAQKMTVKCSCKGKSTKKK